MRQVAHVLLTRPPLNPFPKELHSLDLHVLGTPPAFVLSQDQTLREKSTEDVYAPAGAVEPWWPASSFTLSLSYISRPPIHKETRMTGF